MHHFSRIPKIMLCVSAIVMLAACGGSSSDSDKSSSPNRSVSGTAAKGIISNATVEVFTVTGFDTSLKEWIKGDRIDWDTTDEKGDYTLRIAKSSGPVLVELTVDDNTKMVCDIAQCKSDVYFGEKYSVPLGFKLSAIRYIDAGGQDFSLSITPLTTIAEKNARLQMEKYPGLPISSAIEMGNTLAKTIFGFSNTPTSVQPMDITSETVASNSSRLEQSILNAAFLSQLNGESDQLDALLDTFSSGEFPQGELEDFIDGVRHVVATVKAENTSLNTAVVAFESSLTDLTGPCEADYCSYPIAFPEPIKSNLDKARSLVNNTRGLLINLKEILMPELTIEGERVTPDNDLTALQTAAEELQQGAEPIAVALNNASTFLGFYREAILEEMFDPSQLLEEERNLAVLREHVCNLFFDEEQNNTKLQDQCLEAASHFVINNLNEGVNDGVIVHDGTTWSLNNFGYAHTYFEDIVDEFGVVIDVEEKQCSETIGNNVTIELPNDIKMASASFKKGKTTAKMNGKMTYLSCPQEGLAVTTELDIQQAVFTVDSISPHSSGSEERPELNSMELNATNAKLSSGDTSFTGNLNIKTVRSQNFANLSKENEMDNLIPEKLIFDGSFKVGETQSIQAKIDVRILNADKFAFVDDNTVNNSFATYRFENAGSINQQLVITVNPPNSNAYSYAYRLKEIDPRCEANYEPCGGVEIARFAGLDTSADPVLPPQELHIGFYERVLDGVNNFADCELQEGWWNDFESLCRKHFRPAIREMLREVKASEADCSEVIGFYWAEPNHQGEGFVCHGSQMVFDTNYDFLQSLSPATETWHHHTAHELFRFVEDIRTEDGKYTFYEDKYFDKLAKLHEATTQNQAMPAFMEQANADVDKPNRYLTALVTITAKALKISDNLPSLDIKLTANRTGFRTGTFKLIVNWLENEIPLALNIDVAAKDNAITKATMNDGDNTNFNLVYNRDGNVRGTITRDGIVYGTVEKDPCIGTGCNKPIFVYWLDKAGVTEFESLY